MSKVYGKVRSNAKGFAFVQRLDSEGTDIFVDRIHLGGAVHDDLVCVEVFSTNEGKSDEGRIVEIAERGNPTIVATIMNDGIRLWARPDDKHIVLEIDIRDVVASGVVEGHKVVMGDLEYTNSPRALGSVISILGHRNDPGVDILAILLSHKIEPDFPEEVLAHAQKVPQVITQEEIKKRHDLRNEVIITIDGEDAKDLDDAVSLRLLPNGNQLLGVHIADVSYYVTEGSPIDLEAAQRATSVYVVDRVVPMIPHRLSNGICSLNPHEDRLTLSCQMEIDQYGNIVTHDIFESVINTVERMTYTNVRKILLDEDKKIDETYAHIVPLVRQMGLLADILRKKRVDSGSINFASKEAKIKLDEQGAPVEITFREQSVAEKLIEEFMLAANETVAKHVCDAELPFIYRIHEQPKSDKLAYFNDFVSTFGYKLKGDVDKPEPKSLQRMLDLIKGKPEESVVNRLLLRSMRQARYSETNEGHFGLAKTDYTHFTSPIRRYPDLIVHRLLRKYVVNNDCSRLDHWEELLPEIATHTSSMERRAVDAERDTEELKKTEFMSGRINEVFPATISGVTKFGVFVELENTVEGLVHVKSMRSDHFEYDESQMILVGKNTGQELRIGQIVTVKLKKADVLDRTLDFEILFPKNRGKKPSFNEKSKGSKGKEKSKNKKKSYRKGQA